MKENIQFCWSYSKMLDTIRARRTKVLLVSSSFAIVVYLIRRYRRHASQRKNKSSATIEIERRAEIKKKFALNRQFLHQLKIILKIIFPRLRSNTVFLLFTHLGSLLIRTFLSIYIAHIDGAIVKSLVQRNPYEFVRSIATFLSVAIPASFINSFIRFAESKLALAMRTRLSRHAYDAYFRVRFLFLNLFFLLIETFS